MFVQDDAFEWTEMRIGMKCYFELSLAVLYIFLLCSGRRLR
jgi:hypothetical protein